VGIIRRHPVLSIVAAALVVGLGILTTTAFAVWQAAHTDDAARLDRADAILVLGAAQYGGTPSPVFAGRLEHAELLYRQDRADVVVVLGGNQPGDETTEAESGRAYLIDQGLPPEAVHAEPHGSSTLESLRAARSYMAANGLESAFLVSDPWHNLRVKRMAGDLGIDAYASATWHSAVTSETARMSGYVRETFAYLFYRILGQ
jgi:uncharacterized SAM-binding protein YcdF (DUF218 family)